VALYDDYGDEETRRRQRDEELAGQQPGGVMAPAPVGDGYGDPYDGMGSPESGYGEGGVNNPAYQGRPLKQTGDDVFRGDLKPQQTNTAPPAFQPPATPSSYLPPAAGGAPAAPQVKTPGITDEVTKILSARLKDLQSPGDVASDPIYQQSVRQYQIGQLRGADRERKALAERTAATGGTTSSGGFNVGVRAINERATENQARNRAGLSMDRLQAREQQLVQAIQIARAVGQDDMANQLELQRLQLQQELGRGDLALRGELGRGQLGLGYDNLGFNYADLVTRANRDAVLAALGGGN
jgi:hypothetical protein